MKTPVFCNACGSSGLRRAAEAYECESCRHAQYANSKPSVCAVITRGERVLLVRGFGAGGNWDLPGGFLRLCEDPKEGLRRELREELRAEIDRLELLDARVDPYGVDGECSLNLFYVALLASEELTCGCEIEEFGWFSFGALPRLQYESTRMVLARLGEPGSGVI